MREYCHYQDVGEHADSHMIWTYIIYKRLLVPIFVGAELVSLMVIMVSQEVKLAPFVVAVWSPDGAPWALASRIRHLSRCPDGDRNFSPCHEKEASPSHALFGFFCRMLASREFSNFVRVEASSLLFVFHIFFHS